MRTRLIGLLAMIAALAAGAYPSAAHADPGAPVPMVSCTLDFWTYPGGYSANATVTNRGGAALLGWQVSFTKAANMTLNHGWNGSFSVAGDRVTIQGANYAPLQPGATSHFGFGGTVAGVFTPPYGVEPGCVVRVDGRPAPAILVEPSALTIAEGSGGAFSLRLSSPPAGNVLIGIRTAGTGVWGTPPVVHTFTPANWNTPQLLVMMSQEDADTVDDRVVITVTAPGYTAAVVTLTQDDND
jgi:hypothetical protein